MNKLTITIIGAGLSGSEAALVLSNFAFFHNLDWNINLIEMRSKYTTDIHKTGNFAELVCSNSFKSVKPYSATGMLKYELAMLASPLFMVALKNYVNAGMALAVDRDKFSIDVTNLIKNKSNINIVIDKIEDIFEVSKKSDIVILATGPLTTKKLCDNIIKLTGSNQLFFYDAAAPIVLADSICFDKVYIQDRYKNVEYNDGINNADYLNCFFDKEEYCNFIKSLLDAKRIVKKEFEKNDLFQACQPIEEIARSGFDAPRFGPMKPVGLNYPGTKKRPYAAVQLRTENKYKSSYNIVGFQTNLTFPAQREVFRKIPGLENAEFARYGVMHKNSFINAPLLLDKNLKLTTKDNITENIYVAGQLGGTEGYLEAIRSGHHCAISVISNLCGINIDLPSNVTIYGSLLDYACDRNTNNYQPMHVNFGIICPLDNKVKNKSLRFKNYAERGKKSFDKYISHLISLNIKTKQDIMNSSKLCKQLENIWKKNM